MIPAGFHFLRPDWLYALIPALLLALLVWRRLGQGRDDWAGLVDAHLLRHLAVRERAGMRRWPVPALLLAWALAVVALAGPAWQKVPTPTLDRLDPVVVVLSLSRSMDGTDRKPSRLVAARHKVEDMLGRMKGGQVGLVIYAEAPFVAAPLTEDARVVGQMLPELATDLMPVPGDRPDLGIAEAVKLLKNTGAPTGRIVLVADGPGQNPPLTRAAVSAAAAAGYTVSVLDVRAPGADGATQEALKALAGDGRGRFAAVSPDGRDLDAVLARSLAARSPVAEARTPLQESGLKADQWVDMGPWLLLLAAPLAALAFRRGWLAALPLAFLLGALSGEARAQALEAPDAAALQRADTTWRNLWQTPDQQGASAFSRKDYDTAARTFADPGWKGSALYEGGNYDAAASTFGAMPGADYNRGNALAKAGKLEEAVSAYEAALARDPQDADAQHNLDIVKKVLELRKQQQDEQNKQNQQNQQNQKDQQKQGGGGQSQANQKPSDGKDQKKPESGQDKGQDKGPEPQKDPGDKPQPEQPGPDKGQNKGPNKDQGKDQKDQKKPEQGQGPEKDKGQDKGQDKPDPSKPDPTKPGDKPDPKKPGEDKAPPPDKPGQDQPDPFAPPPPPNQKPEPPQGGPQPQPAPQPSPQGQPKPAQPQQQPAQPQQQPAQPQQQPAQPQQQPAQPQPGQAQPAQPAQPVQVQPGEPPKEPPKDPKMVLVPRPITEQDQNREQALRSVPDDPVGLLRARIRSYYSGTPVPAYEEKGP